MNQLILAWFNIYPRYVVSFYTLTKWQRFFLSLFPQPAKVNLKCTDFASQIRMDCSFAIEKSCTQRAVSIGFCFVTLIAWGISTIYFFFWYWWIPFTYMLVNIMIHNSRPIALEVNSRIAYVRTEFLSSYHKRWPWADMSGHLVSVSNLLFCIVLREQRHRQCSIYIYGDSGHIHLHDCATVNGRWKFRNRLLLFVPSLFDLETFLSTKC